MMMTTMMRMMMMMMMMVVAPRSSSIRAFVIGFETSIIINNIDCIFVSHVAMLSPTICDHNCFYYCSVKFQMIGFEYFFMMSF